MTGSTRHPPESSAHAPRSARGGVRWRPPAPAATGAAALALAGLVAYASRGTPVWTALRDGAAERAAALDRVAEVGALGILTAAAVILVFHVALVRRRPAPPPLSQTMRRALAPAALVVSLLALVAIARSGEPQPPREPGALQLDWFPGLGLANDPEGSPGDRPLQSAAGEDGADPQPDASSAMLLLLLAILGAAIVGSIVWWAYRSRPRPSGGRAETEEMVEPGHPLDVRGTLIGMIEAMLADPDPRTAIIGAYARLLEDLAAYDAGRREHEAPLEHLQRALRRLRVSPEPMRRLVALFEIARFSTRSLTAAHRDQALEALHAALAELEGTTVPRPARAGAEPVGAAR